jgi:hypothetical protein
MRAIILARVSIEEQKKQEIGRESRNNPELQR